MFVVFGGLRNPLDDLSDGEVFLAQYFAQDEVENYGGEDAEENVNADGNTG